MRQHPNTFIEEFTVCHKALLDPERIDDPSNTTNYIKGFIALGETIWLHPLKSTTKGLFLILSDNNMLKLDDFALQQKSTTMLNSN